MKPWSAYLTAYGVPQHLWQVFYGNFGYFYVPTLDVNIRKRAFYWLQVNGTLTPTGMPLH
jgi:hypothetical protein